MFPDVASPADVTPEIANEFKRRRSESGQSPWSIRGDLAALKAVFGKWLGKECGLLEPTANPFAHVTAPQCDDPDIRIVSADETTALFKWLGERWNDWRLPLLYLEVAALLGWRATEIASIREEDLLGDGHVRVLAESSKTRKHKYGWLPASLYVELQAFAASNYAFGQFAGDLRRLMTLWRQQPHHAARIRDFAPKRLVGWLQDELQRFNEEQAAAVIKARKVGQRVADWHPFTLHDFRRTAITGMQMAGVSEKEASVAVGCTPEVMRRHYERLDKMSIAKRSVERRLGADPSTSILPIQLHQALRAGCARGENRSIDATVEVSQTKGA
jgi:integrase